MVAVGVGYVRAIVTGAVVVTLTISKSRFGCWFLTHLAGSTTVLVRVPVIIAIVRHYDGCSSLISRGKYVVLKNGAIDDGRRRREEEIGRGSIGGNGIGKNTYIRFFCYVMISRQLYMFTHMHIHGCMHKELISLSVPVSRLC